VVCAASLLVLLHVRWQAGGDWRQLALRPRRRRLVLLLLLPQVAWHRRRGGALPVLRLLLPLLVQVRRQRCLLSRRVGGASAAAWPRLPGAAGPLVPVGAGGAVAGAGVAQSLQQQLVQQSLGFVRLLIPARRQPSRQPGGGSHGGSSVFNSVCLSDATRGAGRQCKVGKEPGCYCCMPSRQAGCQPSAGSAPEQLHLLLQLRQLLLRLSLQHMPANQTDSTRQSEPCIPALQHCQNHSDALALGPLSIEHVLPTASHACPSPCPAESPPAAPPGAAPGPELPRAAAAPPSAGRTLHRRAGGKAEQAKGREGQTAS
jgi:hypothetical protein